MTMLKFPGKKAMAEKNISAEDAAKNEISLLRKLITDRYAPSLEDVHDINPDIVNDELTLLYGEMAIIRETLRQFAGGNLDIEIPIRGATAGYLKTLQANLRHLAWQVEQVAEGDFSQRVDFMGNFSKAFNSLTLQLEQSIEEQKEREASERTQIMLDAMPLCCQLWDQNMHIIDCNMEAVHLFGFSSKQEFLKQSRKNLLSPEYQPNGMLSADIVHENLKKAFAEGREVFNWIHQKPDGELIPSEVTLVRVWQKDHYIVVSYTRDLRELQKTQSELERERQTLLDILNYCPVSFAILVNGKVKFANPFVQNFMGLNINDDLGDFFADKNDIKTLKAELTEENVIHWRPVTMRSKNGEIKEMLANIFFTYYYDSPATMVWLVDVTQIRKIEADLRSAKETAENLARVKSEFVANISHELKTPMNAVLGMMHLIQGTHLDDKQKDFVDTAEQSARLLLNIINDILDFSEMEAGRLTMQTAAFNLKNAVNEVVSPIEAEAHHKGLDFNVFMPEDLPGEIIGDAFRLKQILLNLLNNAIKFTKKGSITLSVESQKIEQEKVVLEFAVKDTGIGLSKVQQTKLFTPFSQADASITRKYGGTGLGLVISKNLVEMMGGEISCQSRLHHGSVFKFTAQFGLGAVTKPQNNNEAHEDIFKYADLEGLRILLAEDNPINQMVAQELLNEVGINPDVANNGKEALKMLQLKPYDLILMDIQMPGMDGLEATRRVRADKRFAKLPILAMTANATQEDRKKYLETGMNGHIAKPIQPEILYKEIAKWAKPKQNAGD